MDRARQHTAWASHLSKLAKDAPSEFLTEVGNVRGLTEHPGWGFVTDLIQARIESVQDAMLADSGEPLSQAQYARKAGEIVGLQSLADLVDTVLLKAEVAELELERQTAGQAVGG